MTRKSNESDRGISVRIVHVSGDFPDSMEPHKTTAIRALVDLTGDRFDHHVISINRSAAGVGSWMVRALRGMGVPGLRMEFAQFSHGLACRYDAPGRGFFHKTMLDQLGDELVRQVRSQARHPQLLVAHKLTIEGLAVARMARLLDLPFALCIQGDTDTKILSARPDLVREFGQLFHQAKVVFSFAPWSLTAVEARLGRRRGPTYCLPCATELDQPLEPVQDGSGLVSIFHLKNYRRKNLAGMAEALRLLRQDEEMPRLTIAGGGSLEDRRACERLVRDLPNVSFAGPLDRDAVQSRLNAATALVLPSLRESFGLVFVEALFAGIPVIYPRGAAIDGYFEDEPFAIAVDGRDPRSIAEGMRQALANEHSLKRALREWQSGPKARRFQRESIAQTFAKGLSEALGRL